MHGQRKQPVDELGVVRAQTTPGRADDVTSAEQRSHHGSGQRAGQVQAPLGPVKAVANGGSASDDDGNGNVEAAEHIREHLAWWSERDHPIAELHSEPTGEVVVAAPSLAKGLGLAGHAQRPHRYWRREDRQRLQRVRDLGTSQRVVAMPTRSPHDEQAGVEKPAQVRAGGGRADPGESGELASGTGRAVEQGVQHRSAGRVCDHSGDGCDVDVGCAERKTFRTDVHPRIVPDRQFVVRRSVPMLVLTHAETR